ncbi:MAG: hypothetical protein N4A49_00715 [Marinifilaceae bacterium]|jgi:FtsZ-binding cell division protein ZapB|nr:hypothetical protein [Marinifilaceae bacterium]
MADNKKDKVYKAVLVILALVLTTLVIFYFKEKRENQKFVNQITIEKINLENELHSLSQDYDSLKTSNDTINVRLQMEQEKIAKLVEKMKKFRNNSYAELNKYKREIGTLKTVLRSYIVQIDSLNAKNKLLTEENSKVKKQISWVKERNEMLQKSSENMKEIISRASKLELANLICIPVNRKGRQVKKVSKTVKLKTSFIIRKNITTTTGQKTLYVRITRPDDITLGNPDNGMFKYENAEIMYSAKRDIEFEGEELEVAIFWNNDKSLISGTYRIEIFAEGNLIGTTSMKIK